jgi:hypothetical protein
MLRSTHLNMTLWVTLLLAVVAKPGPVENCSARCSLVSALTTWKLPN